jgi:hypothetical protein
MGTVLSRVQPAWDQNVSKGDQTLNQHEVEIDGVGARLIIEECLEATEQYVPETTPSRRTPREMIQSV